LRIAVISHACVVQLNQRLYRELARHEDIELLLVAPASWRASTGKTITFSAPDDSGYEVAPLPVWGSGQISLHWYRGLLSVLRQWKPDLVYIDEEAYSLPAHQVMGACNHLHLPMAFVQTQNLIKRHRWPFGIFERRVLDNASMANPITEECAEVLRANNFSGHIAVIPHCVNTSLFFPQDGAPMRDELGLPGFVVGYLGRLTEEKGLPELMQAADLLWQDAALDFSLLIVGAGPMEEEIAAWALRRPAGRVVMTGPIAHADVPPYMNAFDALALPSRTTPGWKEQFGRVLIEALACGVPLVGSDSGHIPELIQEMDGGLVFPEQDAGALAEALHSLIADPVYARRLGETGRQAVMEEYAVTSVAQRLYEAIAALDL